MSFYFPEGSVKLPQAFKIILPIRQPLQHRSFSSRIRTNLGQPQFIPFALREEVACFGFFERQMICFSTLLLVAFGTKGASVRRGDTSLRGRMCRGAVCLTCWGTWLRWRRAFGRGPLRIVDKRRLSALLFRTFRIRGTAESISKMRNNDTDNVRLWGSNSDKSSSCSKLDSEGDYVLGQR